MDRSSVERLLGSPNVGAFTVGGAIWYLPSPTLKAHESPYAPGSIGIVYSKEWTVLTKELNPQIRNTPTPSEYSTLEFKHNHKDERSLYNAIRGTDHLVLHLGGSYNVEKGIPPKRWILQLKTPREIAKFVDRIRVLEFDGTCRYCECGGNPARNGGYRC